MKYNALFKFLALILCALMLLTAVGGGIGIGVLASLDLYRQTVDAVYEEQMQILSFGYADYIAARYFSVELGGCPEELVNSYYGGYDAQEHLDNGDLGYELLDWNRESLKTVAMEAGSDDVVLEFSLESSRYLRFIRETTYEPIIMEVPTTVPEESLEPPQTETTENEPTEAATEQSQPVESQTEPPVEQTEPTVVQTEPPVGPDSTMATEAIIQLSDDDGFSYGFYDPQEGFHREFLLSHEVAPGCHVRVRLSRDLLGSNQEWDLLRLVYRYRVELFWVSGLSLLLFAALAVYLCCSAGHKPGRQEIRAGGLNRLPLDAYFGLGALGVCGLALVAYEVGEYMWRQSIWAAAAVVAAALYGCALIIVCFLFAFAAQIKTPNGFWWRRSLCGWCLKLVVLVWNLSISVLSWILVKGKKILLWSWDFFLQKLLPLGKRLCVALWKIVCFFWAQLRILLGKLWVRICRVSSWILKKVLRFIAMLPLTWQWLLAAFVMIFILALTVNSYNSGMVLLGLGLSIALVLYGASAFGTLLESAKRMRKGDLDTKVDDKFLVGSFREFAQELNGLAGVAVVAAQKQLRSERMKTELITNVSHDIKTPLTSIINYVDLLEKPHTPEEQEIYLEVLSRQSQRLKKLIEDLMEMSKASTGNMTVEISTVDAVETVNQALGEFADKLEKVPLYPVFKQPGEQVMMLADGRLVWRVLSNVLSNAVKYALPGTRLYVDLCAQDGNVIISLKNISREELNVEADELMERFVRGDVSRNTEGSGLGLNIAKSLMEIQNGKLQLLVDGDLFKVTLIFPGA